MKNAMDTIIDYVKNRIDTISGIIIIGLFAFIVAGLVGVLFLNYLFTG